MAENKPDTYRESFGKPLPKIEGLREKLEEKQLEAQNEVPETKEKIMREEIGEKLNQIQQSSVSDIPISDRDQADEISKLSSEQQIESLISLVFEKGLEKAVFVAKKINNPAILDEFHDILVDKYYEMLVSQGVIKA